MPSSCSHSSSAGIGCLTIVLTVLVLASGGKAKASEADDFPLDAPTSAISFDRDIQPILSQRCIQCHGREESEGGLRLSERDTALAELDSGSRAIIPGDPDQSELLRRVSAADADERMPPTGEPLAAAQIEKLRRWIAQGADWPAHWAYRPLSKPPVPAAASAEHNGWSRTPIDRFVLERLAAKGLSPSPPADKRTLLRRVTFDLVGLPPTIDEMNAFLADSSADAYERVVDRLLASPHYGERWARHWMDVVHYAETHGHDQDRPRPNAWPYRDYLVRAFNQDKPYARFVREQIAGDVLDADNPDAIVATGFLATGPWDESSLRDIREDAIDREIARYLDRDDIVTTAMSTFISTTVHCARCHDHKFDPVTQQEYYGLQAVFAATDKANRAFDPDPQVAARRQQLLEQKSSLPALRDALHPSLLDPALQSEVSAWEATVDEAALIWTPLDATSFTSEHGSMLAKQPDGSLLAGGDRPEADTYTITAQTNLTTITGIRLELLTDDSLPHGGPGRQDNGNLHLNELALSASSSATGGSNDVNAATNLKLFNARADFDQEGWTSAMAVDGDPKTAWGIFPEVGKPHLAVFEVENPAAFAGDVTLTFRLQQTHGGGHLIGRLRLSVTSAPLPLPLEVEALPGAVVAILGVEPAERTDGQRAELAAYVVQNRIDRELAALPPPQMVYCGTNHFEPDGTFRPATLPRPVYVLARGDISQPGEPAVPGALAHVAELDASFELPDPNDEGQRRAALADWLADSNNVLTWRSIVNRVWHYHFGRGLVDTPNDFGRMGSPPTHPELLDWLAATFLESGGSIKQLHRQIVTSAVYCQSSAHRNDYAAVDADNRLLWRMNRSRLDAESIRDAVLQASGKLDRTMGGPSVKQFIQSPGIHVTPIVDYHNFEVDDPANYRRSVYRFIFRTLPDPFMESLDCADASQLTPARNTSVTALQALAMLNDRFIVRQSEHVAQRAAACGPELAAQVEAAYLLVLGRLPTPDESQALAEYAGRHGLANACRVLLNSNEFMFVN